MQRSRWWHATHTVAKAGAGVNRTRHPDSASSEAFTGKSLWVSNHVRQAALLRSGGAMSGVL
jgi:hypothetical protein